MKKTILSIMVTALLILSACVGPGPYDVFAQCIDDSGTKFYGAYWCPHCEEQRNDFGKSQKLLPYIECSLPNNGGQTAACKAAGIESYPTWEFPGGERLTGTLDWKILAEKTGCELPQ